jgi:hypothetical protein
MSATETDRQRADRFERAYDNLGIQHVQAVTNQRNNLLYVEAFIDSDPAMARRMCRNVIEWCEDNGADPPAEAGHGPREELLAELRAMRGGDPESCHMAADRLLVQFVGDDEITEAYQAIGKWYS